MKEKKKRRFLFRKRKTKPEPIEEQKIDAELEQVHADTQMDEKQLNEEQNRIRLKMKQRKLAVEDCCSQLIDASRRNDQAKIEYEQVTAYLTDIQLIDHMSKQEEESVQAVAEKLLILSGDREQMRQENKALTQLQFRFMQLHEHEIEQGIHNLSEQEKYAADIQSDLRKLDEEKMNLKYEERYYLQKLHNLKMIIWSAIFVAVIATGIIGFLYTMYIFDIFFSILLVICALAVCGTFIFVRYRNVNYALAYCRKQQKRAVELINKVKIKWVNNTSTMDYLCSKYNVGSSHELQYLWQQYQLLLQNEEKYKRASKELNHYGELLVKLLQNIGVHDADIWISQPEALIDSREMVEVTHALNSRRQKLREEMEYDEDVMDIAIAAIREDIKKNPEKAVIVQHILEPYRIRV